MSNMSDLETLAKQRIPLLYFVPLRWLLGITWIWFFIQYTILTPNPALLWWTVGALISGVLLLLGWFTRLGAILSVLIAYSAAYLFVVSQIRSGTAFTLLVVSIVLVYWKTGRVLGLDKYLVGKLPRLLETLLL
jgi:hypothetical protein